MQPFSTTLNEPLHHWVEVSSEPQGCFTAHLVGVPDLRATAATREEALEQIRTLISEWMASGRLVSIEVPRDNPLLRFDGHLDPSDPLEQEFLGQLARQRRDDLERTLREYDQECSDSSSTPTT
jgi:predicted RNase H-like HicB family nuclease